jgi:hypothetical protein
LETRSHILMHTKSMLRSWERYREHENGSKNKKEVQR